MQRIDERVSDEDEVVDYYRALADQGHSISQCTLGWIYYFGHGIPCDNQKAFHFFQLAATQGNRVAEYYLGLMHYKGCGIIRDAEKAAHFFHLSADQGYAPAEYLLGLMYYRGQGVLRDEKEAVNLYRLSANQGYAPAQYAVGYLYYEGRAHFPRDFKKAIHFFRLAADQGMNDAKRLLEKMFNDFRFLSPIIYHATIVLKKPEMLKRFNAWIEKNPLDFFEQLDKNPNDSWNKIMPLLQDNAIQAIAAIYRNISFFIENVPFNKDLSSIVIAYWVGNRHFFPIVEKLKKNDIRHFLFGSSAVEKREVKENNANLNRNNPKPRG